MPPSPKVVKEDIIKAGIRMIEEKGIGAVNARSLATYMNCSTQPIFSNFASMEELKVALIEAANTRYQAFLQRENTLGRYPEYKASGMAYIRFAREEKELFKFLFMRDRSDETVEYLEEDFTDSVYFLHKRFGISYEDATMFHMEMWAFVHGIATMLATSYLDLEWEEISTMLTDAFTGLKKSHHIAEDQSYELDK